jgi:hypothetical protein
MTCKVDANIRPHKQTHLLPYKTVTLPPEHARGLPEHGAVAAKRAHNATEQPEEKSQKKQNFFSLFVTVRQTQSIVEIHERSVLHQCDLRRDESETSGDEKRQSHL